MSADEYREDTSAIEVSFAVPVNLSDDHQRRLIALINEVCDDYEKRHPERVMWTFGMGQKMLTNPFMVDDDHPMQFDESVFQIECAERENYEHLASGMEAPTGGETENTGSTEGDSPAPKGDAQTAATPRTPPDYGGNE